jgi:PPM family protein phosphatase
MPNKPMNPHCDFAGTQDQGRRAYQEDAFDFHPLQAEADGSGGEGLLMVLADGMGGHQGGAVASSMAVSTFIQAYGSAVAEPETGRLEQALLAANYEIAREATSEPGLRGMGCTLVGVTITPRGVQWISVGDSPLFLFRNGELKRLNADHSMVPVLQHAVSQGVLSDSEAASHPERQALRSAVTGKDLNLVDLQSEPVELLPGDRLLLVSDGIFTLSASRIIQLIAQHADWPAEELSRHLVQAVSEAGNPHQDNVTVMVAAMPAPAAAPAGSRPRSFARIAGVIGEKVAGHRMLHPGVLLGLAIGFLLAAFAVNSFMHSPFPLSMLGLGESQPEIQPETGSTGADPGLEAGAEHLKGDTGTVGGEGEGTAEQQDPVPYH